MGLYHCCCLIKNDMIPKLVVVLLFLLVAAKSLYSLQQQHPSCHNEERSALLQFKQSFRIDIFASGPPDAYPKVSSWKSVKGENSSNCCLWDGVECDDETGHVIGLNLSSSCLYGSINSSNSLFRLVHLQRLDLSYNDFNDSQIPASIRNLTSLTHLDLSLSCFIGPIPASIFANLTQLTWLGLYYNNLNGPIPSSIGNLGKLTSLFLVENNLNGPIPSSIGNLGKLTSLYLRENNLNGPIPSSIGNLRKLTLLHLGSNNLNGPIPSSIGNLSKLTYLYLYSNNLNGPIPSSIGNLSKLTSLALNSNNLNGSIPESLANLVDLQRLYLGNNNLSGMVEFHWMFHKLQNLTMLDLSSNKFKLELLTDSRVMNASTLQQFVVLVLGWCNIREFPSFLRYQKELEWLDLSGNSMHGLVPKWMFNTSTLSLNFLNISHNFLSGFERPPVVLPWVQIQVLDLSFNMLHGPLQLPNASNFQFYGISNNQLRGKISPLICNLSTLKYLDLSNNKLSGELPQCLGNFSDDLLILNLGNNSFQGILPQIYSNRSKLTMIDVSHNQLQGHLPRSLANCVKLEFLVLSHNQFSDVFPFWLGNLHKLKLLAMNHNQFYNVVAKLENNHSFPKLHIIDLSYNNFTGDFPTEYILSSKFMRGITPNQPMYMNSTLNIGFDEFVYSITITNKGVERYFQKIREDLIVIDLSSNKFEGNIPEFIGNLKGVRSLNISNNNLSGPIPRSLGNLALLESLDLSQNKLSGHIPQQLTLLGFLEQFNVSHNNLIGRIPVGNQLVTFDNTSYMGNLGLCGPPMTKECGIPAPPTTEEDDSTGIFGFDWKFAFAGIGSGFVVGVVLADIAITRRQDCFLKVVEIMIRLISKMESWGRHRN